MTKSRKRFIQAVIATASRLETTLPWQRGPRAMRRAEGLVRVPVATTARPAKTGPRPETYRSA
ncbi:hypothetical protein E0K89_016845 [Aquicoccus sp. SCR17]|nr:hypothetical protein [Carideicomes alvinocaridis]